MKINKLRKLTKSFADAGTDSFSGARNNSHLILVPHCKQSCFQYILVSSLCCYGAPKKTLSVKVNHSKN